MFLLKNSFIISQWFKTALMNIFKNKNINPKLCVIWPLILLFWLQVLSVLLPQQAAVFNKKAHGTTCLGPNSTAAKVANEHRSFSTELRPKSDE